MSTPAARKLLGSVNRLPHQKKQQQRQQQIKEKQQQQQKLSLKECIEVRSNSIIPFMKIVCHVQQVYRFMGSNEQFSEELFPNQLSASTDKNSDEIKTALQFVKSGDNLDSFKHLVRSHVSGRDGKRPTTSPFLSVSTNPNCDFMKGFAFFLNQYYKYIYVLEIDKLVLGKVLVDPKSYCSKSDQGMLLNTVKSACEFLVIGDIPVESISNVYIFSQSKPDSIPKICGKKKFRETHTFEERLAQQRKEEVNDKKRKAEEVLENNREKKQKTVQLV